MAIVRLAGNPENIKKLESQRKDHITHYATMQFDSVNEYKAWCKRLHITPDLPDSKSE